MHTITARKCLGLFVGVIVCKQSMNGDKKPAYNYAPGLL